MHWLIVRKRKSIVNQNSIGTVSKATREKISETGWSAYGPFRAHRHYLELNWVIVDKENTTQGVSRGNSRTYAILVFLFVVVVYFAGSFFFLIINVLYHVTTSPKSFFRVLWRVGEAVVGRGNAGWKTSKSGHPCPCPIRSWWPPARKRLEENFYWIVHHVPPTT